MDRVCHWSCWWGIVRAQLPEALRKSKGSGDQLAGADGKDQLDGFTGRDVCDGGPPATGDTAKNGETVRNVP